MTADEQTNGQHSSTAIAAVVTHRSQNKRRNEKKTDRLWTRTFRSAALVADRDASSVSSDDRPTEHYPLLSRR